MASDLEKAQADFLDLTDEEQRDIVVDLAHKKAYVKSLSTEKQRLANLIFKNERSIERWLRDLDVLKREEYESRVRDASKEEAKIAATISHDAVVKVIQRRFIKPLEELDKFSVEELRNRPEAVRKTEMLFRLCGLPFPNKAVKIFPGSRPEDFPKDLFESVRAKLNAVKAMQR